MGRGLSPLQKSILRIAAKNHDRECHGGFEHLRINSLGKMSSGCGCDAYYREVLFQHFGLPMKKHWWRNHDEPIREAGGHVFSMREIGEKRYRSIQASVSRAVDRLWKRDYITPASGAYARWSGCDITAEGYEQIKSLMVNTRDNCP